jgi:hypothetical protein
MSTKSRLVPSFTLALGAALAFGAFACKPKSPTSEPGEPIAVTGDPAPESKRKRARGPKKVAEAPVAKVYPEPPPSADPRPFAFPDVGSFTLDNGLKVFVVENHEVPTVTVQLVIRAGAMDDPHLAPFTAGMLGEGTTTRSKTKLDEAIEFVGGSMGAGAGMHASSAWATSSRAKPRRASASRSPIRRRSLRCCSRTSRIRKGTRTAASSRPRPRSTR